MHYTVERILRGDTKILDDYRAATERWKEILARPEAGDVDTLAKMLQGQQSWFERHCGGRWEGQEVMVLSGIGTLYTTEAGFAENEATAQRLVQAFLKSFCSIEVKSIARRTGQAYDLIIGDE